MVAFEGFPPRVGVRGAALGEGARASAVLATVGKFIEEPAVVSGEDVNALAEILGGAEGVLGEPVEGVGDAGKVVRPAGAAGHEFLADLVVIVAPIRGILRRALLPGARERQLAATTRGGKARVMTAPDTTTCRVVTTRGRRSARGRHRRGEDRGNARHLTRPLVDVAVESRSSIATRTFEVRVGGVCARVASQGSPIGPKPHRGDFDARWRNDSSLRVRFRPLVMRARCWPLSTRPAISAPDEAPGRRTRTRAAVEATPDPRARGSLDRDGDGRGQRRA